MINQPIVNILDILLVWFLIYRLLIYARGTQVMNLLKGVAIFILAKFISSLVGLQTIDWLLGQVLAWGVVAAIILFQPELRRALVILGRNLFRNRREGKNNSERLIDDLEKSISYMSKRRIGALISIEGQEELQEYVATGILIDAEVSNQLLTNIFIPNTPLHDGAVIISGYRVSAASCFLPLSESNRIPKELGTRHRAAIGLGEVTDALTIIVSEETGGISIVKGTALYRDLEKEEVRQILEENLIEPDDQPKDYLQIAKDFFLENFQRGDK